jgi:hypothetical protein
MGIKVTWQFKFTPRYVVKGTLGAHNFFSVEFFPRTAVLSVWGFVSTSVWRLEGSISTSDRSTVSLE